MRKRIVSYLLCAAMVLCTVVGIGMPVIAAEGEETEFVTNIDEEFLLAGDTTWQENFDYEIDGNYIVLKKYTGNVENLDVPATATISGKQYKVKLNDTCSHMFYECGELKTISFSKDIDTSNVTDMSSMFHSCSNLTNLDISNFNTSNVTNMSQMFSRDSNLTNLDVSHFNTSNVTSMRCMFNACSSLTKLDVSNFNTSNVTDMCGMFDCCSSLTKLDVSNFNTSNVTDMSCMFSWDSNLTNLDVSHFNTSNVTNMWHMFNDCSSLTKLDVSNFNTSNVTNMSGMFAGCRGVTKLDVSNFNTSNVTDMSFMFSNCYLKSIDLSSFDTSNVTNMEYMFGDCDMLESLDLRSFDMKKVENINGMFSGSKNLKSIDMSTWNLNKVKYNLVYEYDNMFHLCSNLYTIKTPLNLKEEISLPGTFVREDNPSEEYTSLPMNQSISFTLVKKDSGPTPGGNDNVIDIDTNNGTATIPDKINGGTTQIALYVTQSSGVFRLYNPVTYEHYYTKDQNEVNHNVYEIGGWQLEGNGEISVDANEQYAVPVYRLFNKTTNTHFYTTDLTEAKTLAASGTMNYEGISHYVYDKDSNVGTVVHRICRVGSTDQLWTKDANEINTHTQVIGDFTYVGPAWRSIDV